MNCETLQVEQSHTCRYSGNVHYNMTNTCLVGWYLIMFINSLKHLVFDWQVGEGHDDWVDTQVLTGVSVFTTV